MMSPVCCLLYPASCHYALLPVSAVCVYVCVCVQCALCLSLSLWVGHIKYARYCTLIYVCAAMLSHLFTQAFGDNYPRPPPHLLLSLSVALPLNAPAPGQPCTSIDNNSQAQKTAYFQYDVVSITVILPYMPLSYPLPLSSPFQHAK